MRQTSVLRQNLLARWNATKSIIQILWTTIVLGKFGSSFRFKLELNRTEHEVQVRGSANL
jgi:hypothetical protein